MYEYIQLSQKIFHRNLIYTLKIFKTNQDSNESYLIFQLFTQVFYYLQPILLQYKTH